MEFEWDEAKDRINVAKHSVSFEEAIEIFDGPVVTFADDRFDYDEERSTSIGMTHSMVFVTVAHTDREGVTRIIMARRATKNERNSYVAEIEANRRR